MLLFRTHQAKAERMIRNNNVLPERNKPHGTIVALKVTDALKYGWKPDRLDRFQKAIAFSTVIDAMAADLKREYLATAGLRDWA